MKKVLFCLGVMTLAACDADPSTAPTPASDLSLSASAGEHAGAVYTLTNAVAGNAVLAFARSPNGLLTSLGSFPTGDNGNGAGLGSQGAVILSANGTRLFAVNAGSNSISSFAARKDGTLELISTVPSGGVTPTSLTINGDLLYVLNAGGAGNITGFRNARAGDLQPIAGSTKPLSSSASAAAQVEFNPSGDFLVVTERATNVIGVYTVNGSGIASGPSVVPSAGPTPFGFAFGRRGRMIVSEAFGGAADASAVSSYRLGANGALEVISASVPTTETAACWIVITRSGRFTYTSNTGSGSITGYRIHPNGSLEVLDADGLTGVTGAGSSPIDLALSRDSRFLFSANTGNGSISIFVVRANGSLEALPDVSGLPLGIVGLAAR